MHRPNIALYGATGFTGKLVAAELAAKTDGFVISGRNASKLDQMLGELRGESDAEIEARVASVDDAGSLDAMLDGIDVLINCAGPFTDIGQPVVEAAVRNGAHYLDSTGEQPFMKWVQTHLAADAVEQGVVLVPGCAYEYAVGNFAAKLATGLGARRLGICYAVRNMGMSHGTKKSVVRALASRGYTYVDGHLEPKKPAYRLFDVPLPSGRTLSAAWFPGGESLTVPLFAKVSQVESCLAVGDAAGKVLRLLSPVVDKVADRAMGVADRVIELTSGDPHEQGSRPDFIVAAFDPSKPQFLAGIAGTDPYDVTARVLVEAARRIIEEPPEEGGFTSPAALFDVRDFLEAVDLDIV